MNVDILVFAPHPDDAELICGGLLLKAKKRGLKTAVVDLTRGEMGTRGSVDERFKEAAAATQLMGLAARENAALSDGHLYDNDDLRVAMVRMLRKYRPSLMLIPHWEDQHPDHAAVGQAGVHAAFLAGVPKYDTQSAAGVAAADRLPYRPRLVLHYNNRFGIRAEVVVDVSDVIEEKIKLVQCFATQFGAGNGGAGVAEPQTKLSSTQFIDWLRGMHAFYGYQAGVKFGEAYCAKSPICISDVGMLLG